MESNQNPKVYVGTYHKYNNGSIDGAWIDLTECQTYSDFIKKCREVHKDEKDPEFMIQDVECFPDGLGCMEWLSEEDFNDVITEFNNHEQDCTAKYQIIDYSEKAIAVVGDTIEIKDELKRLGGRFNARLSCGAGWIFPKSKLADVRSLIGNSGNMQANGAKPKAEENPFKAILDEYLGTRKLPSDKTYYGKNNIGAVRANGGYIMIEKPDIINRFCFHDEGPQYEEYKEVTKNDNTLEKYFLSENLDNVDSKIKSLESNKCLYMTQPNGYNGQVTWNSGRYGEKWDESDVEMTKELREELIKAYKVSRSLFEKRLKNYLKRYGTSKIHTWTYWADA